MPSKIQQDENLRFLWICHQQSDFKTIDFQAVSKMTNIKAPAARMRYTRLKKAIEAGSAFSSSSSQFQSGSNLGTDANIPATSVLFPANNMNNIVETNDSEPLGGQRPQIFFPPTDITRDKLLKKRKRSSTMPTAVSGTAGVTQPTEGPKANDDFDVIQTRSGSRISRAKDGEEEHVYVEGNDADDEDDDYDDCDTDDDDRDHIDENPKENGNQGKNEVVVLDDQGGSFIPVNPNIDHCMTEEVVGPKIDVKIEGAQNPSDNVPKKEEENSEDEEDLPLMIRRRRLRAPVSSSSRVDLPGGVYMNQDSPYALADRSWANGWREETGPLKTNSSEGEKKMAKHLATDPRHAGCATQWPVEISSDD
ncbi:MAG: hypothetical protein M1823_001950 [Watsoniomyces obsoletus]|nr:MAG: hypothetical protein M1823_001950 [Watsoniomyces obsoletus]